MEKEKNKFLCENKVLEINKWRYLKMTLTTDQSTIGCIESKKLHLNSNEKHNEIWE